MSRHDAPLSPAHKSFEIHCFNCGLRFPRFIPYKMKRGSELKTRARLDAWK